MAAGEWISVSAQNELIERELAIERRELARNPAAETDELAEMYVADGMTPDDARAGRRRRDAPARRRRSPCTPGPSSASTRASWRRRGAAARLSLVCFLFGALLPVLPWLLGADGHGADRGRRSLIGVVAAAVVGALIGRLAERLGRPLGRCARC